MTMTDAIRSPNAPAAATAAPPETFRPFGADGLTFTDFLDIINPLQHIPIISTIYRRLTGDTLDPASRLAGGTLFGGPLGAAAALVNVVVEGETGKDVGENIATAFLGDANLDTRVADAAPAPAMFEVRRGESEQPAADWPTGGLMPDPVTVAALDAPSTAAAAGGTWTPLLDLGSLTALAPGEPAISAPDGRSAALGATASEGGWFTETMLSALRKYQDSIMAAQAVEPSVVQTL